MSIVRYVNKKTGKVTLYESTSHYDPETKQSRPIRKYLGVEDPETGQLIPTTRKPGRRADPDSPSSSSKSKDGPDYKAMYESIKKESDIKDKMIKELEGRIRYLEAGIERLGESIAVLIKK